MRSRRVLLLLPVLLIASVIPAGAVERDGKAKPEKAARDKSKPIRRGIEEWYERNKEAFRKKEVAAVMALRTEDFHTVTPDGRTNTRADMEAYTRRLFDRIDHFVTMEFEIGTITLEDGVASADVMQRTVRKQRLPDGQLHEVEAGAVQTERWKLTPEGWKLWRVDNIRDRGVLVDGRPHTPGQ